MLGYNIGTMKRYNVYFSEKQLEQLTSVAQDTGIKIAEHIRRAIDEYLERLKRRRRSESLK
jgi:hypothetical protein